jgi:hypothetical protein
LRDPGSIVEIMVGPAADRGAEEMVSELLNKLGYPELPVTRGRA